MTGDTDTVVVAGVGSGLGSSLVEEFAAAGADVAAFARSAGYIEEVATEVSADQPGRVAAVPTDVSDPTAVTAGFDEVRDRFGPVDTLVFNLYHTGSRDDDSPLGVSRSGFRDAWETTVVGAFQCVEAAAEDMADSPEGGSILVTAPFPSRVPAESVTRTTTRHALRGLTRSVSERLGDRGVQAIHVVVDGWIAKPELRAEYPDHERWMDPDEMATVYRELADAPETVHASEVDLRHPGDELRF